MNNDNQIIKAKGRPMLRWVGKKPLSHVKGFPVKPIEVFNRVDYPKEIDYKVLKNNWFNLLFEGDNKEVLSTLLEKGFRGKIDLVYIDPPFKSGADYIRKVELRGIQNLGKLEKDEASLLQQTMYFDIWNNDSYLQFIYERLLLLKELLAETGSIFLHLDWHIGHYVKLLMDEVFGEGNFRNEIVWAYTGPGNKNQKYFTRKHEIIFWYTKSEEWTFNKHDVLVPYKKPIGQGGTSSKWENDEKDIKKLPEKYKDGKIPEDWWDDISPVGRKKNELTNFKTQKPEKLVERIIKASSNKGDIILDCFLGSGTTVTVAQKLNRRWIGCDINKGAIQLTCKRVSNTIKKQQNKEGKNDKSFCLSFVKYKVNDYDLNLLRTEAINLAIDYIGIKRKKTDRFFDGLLGNKLVKIIDFNHPLGLLDLQLIQDELKSRPDESRDVTVVCLGKNLAVNDWINRWNKKYPINKIDVIELKTDNKYGNFLIHKPAEAKVEIKRINGSRAKINIENFISPTIIKRLNIDFKEFRLKIPDFRSMIDSILIDDNYDGKTFNIRYPDIPENKEDLVKGKYEIEIPKNKTTVAVKITDMLGEEILKTKKI